MRLKRILRFVQILYDKAHLLRHECPCPYIVPGMRQGLSLIHICPLNLRRKASTYYIRASGYKASLQSRGLVFAYALAVSEENASGVVIVTAPTCGSCGIVPAVLYHLQMCIRDRNWTNWRNKIHFLRSFLIYISTDNFTLLT